MVKHWSKVEYLHQTVKNPNIVVKGTKSYYSDAWSGSFEESVVRYHYGDEYSLAHCSRPGRSTGFISATMSASVRKASF